MKTRIEVKTLNQRTNKKKKLKEYPGVNKSDKFKILSMGDPVILPSLQSLQRRKLRPRKIK